MALGITVEFNAEMVKFSQQLDKIGGQMDQFQARAESSVAKIGSVLSGLGVGLSAAGFASFVKSGIDAADALNDLSDRSGIAIEKLAGLELAVKLGDTSMEAFIGASNKLSINIAKNAEEFAKIGITAKDPVEAFKQLSDIFSSIEDPQQRAALGAAALGKSYAEMAPLLMQGADGIQALIDKGQEHNPVTAEQARLAGEFNDQLDMLSNRMHGFSIIVSGPVLEALNEFGTALQFAMDNANGFNPLEFMTDFANGGNQVDQLGRLNEQIQTLQANVNGFDEQSGIGRLFDTVLGDGSLGEQQRKLEQLIATRDKLLNPDSGKPDKPATAKPTDSAITGFIQKTGDETDESGKKFKKASEGVKTYRTEVDLLTKSLTDANAKLAAQRPDNLLQLENITATPQQQAELRRKALTQKNIEFDKANKTGNLADAARIAQEREQLAFENAKEDLYGVRSGELPSYKAFDAKQNYNKAVADSKKAFDRFQATGQTGTAGQPDATTADGSKPTDAKPGTVDGKTDLATQISQAEQLKKLLTDLEKPFKVTVESNMQDTIKQADELQQKLNAISTGIAAANDATSGNAGNVNQALSTEVLKRGSRT